MKNLPELSKHKSVRIDSKTVILVNRSVPDDIARAHYLNNVARSAHLIDNLRSNKFSRKKKPIEEIEQEELLEQPELPEQTDDEEDE